MMAMTKMMKIMYGDDDIDDDNSDEDDGDNINN